jgi:hypothetical protein
VNDTACGWGADSLDEPPKGWRCPLCNRKARYSRHRFKDLEPSELCTDCARNLWLRETLAEIDALCGLVLATKGVPETVRDAVQLMKRRLSI